MASYLFNALLYTDVLTSVFLQDGNNRIVYTFTGGQSSADQYFEYDASLNGRR